jgi:hypothetical protein
MSADSLTEKLTAAGTPSSSITPGVPEGARSLMILDADVAATELVGFMPIFSSFISLLSSAL